jgi:hypothetical protein
MSSDQKTVKPVMEHTRTTHSETPPIEFQAFQCVWDVNEGKKPRFSRVASPAVCRM